MDNLLDFLNALPQVPLYRGILVVAAVLMVATLWLVRRKQKLAAGVLAGLALLLGIGAAVRLATWKEPTFCERYLVATQYYDRVAIRQLAGIIQKQYPRYQVVLLLPPEIKGDGPNTRIADMASALGPQFKPVGACIKPEESTLDELMAEFKVSRPLLDRQMVKSSLNNFFEDWRSGRHFVQAINSTGLTGDIVVVSFAGMPRKGVEEIKKTGHPVLMYQGIHSDVLDLVDNGTVAAAIQSRPGRTGELRCFRNQDKAFAHRWVMIAKSTLAEVRQIPKLFPEMETNVDPIPSAKN